MRSLYIVHRLHQRMELLLGFKYCSKLAGGSEVGNQIGNPVLCDN